jgi:hypothetical protein
MGEDSRRKPIKGSSEVGEGESPGPLWNVDQLDEVLGEVMSFLTRGQYAHLSAQVRELARTDDPTHSETIDIRQVHNFCEIRDRGGILQKINARVFFFVDRPTRTILILGASNTNHDRETPIGTIRCMQRRMRRHLQPAKVPRTRSRRR